MYSLVGAVATAMLSIVFTAVSPVFAQSFPSKPVRIVAPFPPGGPVDALARVLAPKLSEYLKQPVIVDNRPGAGGNLAADLVAKSAPDGYTILMTPNGLAISPVLYRKLPFDPAKDFAAVTQLVDSRQILVARAGLAGSVREFIALAKAKPGALNSGTAGIGNSLHMTMEMITSATGIDVLSVPYKGEPAIVLALLAGEVDVAVLPTSGALLQHFRAGRLRALGHTSAKRVAELPDIPTIGEDIPGFVAGSWQGFFVPAKTPKAVIDLIQAETARALQHPEVRDHILAGGGRDIVASRPEEFDALFKSDLAKFARIGREAKIPFQD
ncbi:MAG: Bug family tripartite tricarboxylate transporter substrate binding protein [Burkholderiales bacterium]